MKRKTRTDIKDNLINFNVAKKILRLNGVTLLKFVIRAKVDIFTLNGEDYLSEKALLRALKLKKLPGKFLLASEAAAKLGISESQLLLTSRHINLPCCRLNWRGGSQILFIEESI